MSQVLAQVTIGASLDQVWAALVDSGRLAQWLPRNIDLDSFGRLGGAGASPRYYHYDLFSTAREQTIRWETNRAYSYQVSNIGPIQSAMSSFVLTPCPEGTYLTQCVSFQMKFGPLGAALDSLVFRSQFRKQMETSLAGLKDFVEARPNWESRAQSANTRVA